MSDCERTREWLLQADHEALRSPAATMLEHIETCAACAEQHRAVEIGSSALGRELRRTSSRLNVDDAIALARPAVGTMRQHRSPALGWARWAAWVRWAAIPAAAAVAFFLFVRSPVETVGPTADAFLGSANQEPRSFGVEAVPEGRFAVFESRNPKIHVVWLY